MANSFLNGLKNFGLGSADDIQLDRQNGGQYDQAAPDYNALRSLPFGTLALPYNQINIEDIKNLAYDMSPIPFMEYAGSNFGLGDTELEIETNPRKRYTNPFGAKDEALERAWVEANNADNRYYNTVDQTKAYLTQPGQTTPLHMREDRYYIDSNGNNIFGNPYINDTPSALGERAQNAWSTYDSLAEPYINGSKKTQPPRIGGSWKSTLLKMIPYAAAGAAEAGINYARNNSDER